MGKSSIVNVPQSGQQGFQKTHGLHASPEYNVWNGMKHRCHNPNYGGYYKYGARGIFVCDRWRESFAAFYEDMGPRPSSKHSIERVDNDGPYSPDNCRWATLDVQANNKRRSIRVNVGGEDKTLRELAEESGVDIMTIRRRHWVGCPDEQLTVRRIDRTGVPNLKNRGQSSGTAKFTEDDVRTVRALWKSGVMQKDIAAQLGVSRSAVNAVVSGRRWGWLI